MIQLKSLMKEQTIDWNSIDWTAAEKKYVSTKKVDKAPSPESDKQDKKKIDTKLSIDEIFEKYKLGYKKGDVFYARPGNKGNAATSNISYVDALSKLINSPGLNIDEEAFLDVLASMDAEDIKTLFKTYYDELDNRLLGQELYDNVFDVTFGVGYDERRRYFNIFKNKGITLYGTEVDGQWTGLHIKM